jgi:hypothetical protein
MTSILYFPNEILFYIIYYLGNKSFYNFILSNKRFLILSKSEIERRKNNIIEIPEQQLINYFNNDIWGPRPEIRFNRPENVLLKYKTFFVYVMKIYNSIINNTNNHYSSLFVKFLHNFNPENIIDLEIKKGYISLSRDYLEEMLLKSPDIPIINIDHSYFIVGDILKTIFCWNKIYFSDNENLVKIINKMKLFYQLIPDCSLENLQQTKANFINFIRIIFDYGIKCMFIFDNTLEHTTIRDIIDFRIDDITDRLNNEIIRLNQVNTVATNEILALHTEVEGLRILNRPNRPNRQNDCNISGGNINYHDKYMKYKTKYLNKNNKN